MTAVKKIVRDKPALDVFKQVNLQAVMTPKAWELRKKVRTFMRENRERINADVDKA